MRRTGLVCCLLASIAGADRIVNRYGEVKKVGTITMEKAGCRVGSKVIPFKDIYLAEREDGTFLYAPTFQHRVRGYVHLANVKLRREYMSLALAGAQSGDTELAQRALRRAENAGLAGKEMTRVKRALTKRYRRKHNKRLRKIERELGGRRGRLVAERAKLAIEQGKPGKRLLLEALRLASSDELAWELLRKLAPPDFKLGNERRWLEWDLALQATGGQLVTSGSYLTTAQGLWRRDLHAVEAAPIRLITPLRDSRLVGRCLAYGRLACRALTEVFPAPDAKSAARPPMTVFLYGSKKEYLTVSGTDRPMSGAEILKWSAGYYSPSERISRFYWYADLMAERRIIGTFVHELTHQWLAEQNPQIPPGAHRSALQKGYWIVEGFADFMKEGEYDIDRNRFRLANPRAQSLDSVFLLAKKKSLLPWDQFFLMDQRETQSLGQKAVTTVALRWRLEPLTLSRFSIFYEQAAATCHFLFNGEKGRYRQSLRDLLVAYYSGKADIEVFRFFGLSAKELGQKVEQYCDPRVRAAAK